MAGETTTGAAGTDTTTQTQTGAADASTAQTGATQQAGGATQTDTGTQTQQTGTQAATTTEQTTAATDWRASITDPEQLEFAKRIASPTDAVKVALDLRKANSSMIRVPGKDATPEDRAKFNKAIGVPETVEGYTFDLGREPTDADKAIQGSLAKVALEAGVPATAMAALSKVVTELATAQQDEANRVALQARETTEAALKKEWGADYDANVNLAKRAVSAFGEVKSHPEAVEFFDKTMVNGQKLGDHPVILRMFGNIGRRMGEGEFIGAVGGNERSSLQTELNNLLAANPVGTPAYAKPEVQKRVMEINEALHGTGGIVGVGGRAV